MERQFPIRLVCLGRNLGFARNVNQGLKLCQHEEIVVVSNDDVVATTLKWREYVEEDLQNPEIAAVGATSNYVLDIQMASRPGPQHEIVPALSFFWIAVHRRAWEAVGLLDEDFGLGLCEDLDWSIRARKAGLKLLLDRRLFIWHWGSQTLKHQTNIEEQDAQNRVLLHQKHGANLWDL
jgi:GT2 family glycosyltransferase